MRKLIVLALLAIGMIASAQSFSSRNYYQYTGVTGDTAVSGTNATVSWVVPRSDLYLYRVECEIDEISGSANAIVILQGSMNNSTWFEVDTLAGEDAVEAQTADGYVFLEDFTTGLMYRYLRVTMILSTTGKWDYNYIRFRAVGKNEED